MINWRDNKTLHTWTHQIWHVPMDAINMTKTEMHSKNKHDRRSYTHTQRAYTQFWTIGMRKDNCVRRESIIVVATQSQNALNIVLFSNSTSKPKTSSYWYTQHAFICDESTIRFSYFSSNWRRFVGLWNPLLSTLLVFVCVVVPLLWAFAVCLNIHWTLSVSSMSMKVCLQQYQGRILKDT